MTTFVNCPEISHQYVAWSHPIPSSVLLKTLRYTKWLPRPVGLSRRPEISFQAEVSIHSVSNVRLPMAIIVWMLYSKYLLSHREHHRYESFEQLKRNIIFQRSRLQLRQAPMIVKPRRNDGTPYSLVFQNL